MPSVKYFTHDMYVALSVEYFDFDRKYVKASSRFLPSPVEGLRLETRVSSKIYKDISMATSSNGGPISP